MAEIVNWYLVSESYSENTSLSASSHESATGKSHGIVALNRTLTLKLCAKLPAGSNPNSTASGNPYPVPAPVTAVGDLTLAVRGTSTTKTISPLTGHNYCVPSTDPDYTNGTKWVLQGGNAFMEGYQDELTGVTTWTATYISEAMDVKRLSWFGAMSPTKFGDLQHESV